jgi:acyl transferase domain-containing protein/acyl-CoA synthetase (AMP-forming)/AMP-acid ligase II/NADPH:quinone reductase-like Zn-dependent oxidoreductase/acyl carrier protein
VIQSSLPAVLRERASLRPSEAAFTYVDYEQDWAGVEESLTWSQLYWRAENVARELRACGSTGDRAVILAPQGLDYVAAFLGALQAGQIAVPLSVPLGGSSDERVGSVLSDASPSAILTTSSVAANIADYIKVKPGESAPSVIEVDLLDLDSQKGSVTEVDSPPSIAHLQYTSGSTRTPAGVMVSHKNIQVNVEQIMSAYYQEGVAPPDTTVVSWLPLFHDMGLIFGIAFPILGGFRTVLTSPPAFLQRPARWMQMLASNTHAFSAAPNVGFELAARKTSDDDLAGLDLGGVRNILNGAERVNPPTLQRFAERFARFNLRPEALRPSYGLAEATLYVATRKSGQPPETVHFEAEELTAGHAKRCASGDGTPLVSYGVPQSPPVRIVDPETSIECPAGTVGEIWTRGDNVASGYWQKPEETEHSFGATLVDPVGDPPEGPWLRTGDLGVFSDGELFIIGRIKDLLIVYGRNYSPDDIEATIQEITRNRCVAIAVPDEDVEKLVAIVELKAGDESEEAAAQRLGAARREIIAAISRSHGLSVADLVLVPTHSIPLTTSGKVRRRDCLQLYLRNEFTRLDAQIRPPAPRVVDDTDSGAGANSGLTQRVRTLHEQQHDLLVGVVCAQAATVLGRPNPDDIDPEGAFQDLGFDSVKATELLDRLKTVTELELPPTLAFDYPTPNALATHLGKLMTGSVAVALPVEAQAALDEPVAVVGMACRFPGGVDSAAALWDLVAGGTDAVGEFPADRGWNLADLFDPDPDAVGKTYTHAGGFLADVAGFDAEFFGISAREAQSMDPQQRLLLEVCWEALENARIDPAGLVGSETGVFVGAWSQQYGAGGSDGAEGYALTGLSTSVASGRVAYALGLQGPAITLDTACSSSLVATHLACQSLRNGESALALAGGVTVMTTPSVFTEFARQRGLAADGRCKAFSANADGTGWGEGAAVLVLERLSDAHRNDHPVLAVIAGSAINQDGASNGLAAPNGPAQQRVIAQAVANAAIGLDQVDVVEAHGTGTTLGDPIEAGALIATYGASRDPERPLWLGSIKSNIGHTQAAAGAAGMIKMIAALNHDSLPPTLNVERPSPRIDWSAGTVRLLTEAVAWPVTDHPRTAAVSSFGISGTNAHLILQQAPDPPVGSADARPPAGQTHHGDEFGLPLWPVSARTPAALCAQADRLHEYLVGHTDLDLTDVAYSLATTRTHHPYRAAITVPVGSADPRADLLGALDALRAGQPHPQLTQHHLARLRGKTVFVLPGQGGQHPEMGRELYEHNHVFADTVDACDQALRPFTDWSVREVLCQDPAAPPLDRVDVVQPVLFTMMVSLAAVLESYGVVPDAVIGHSQGEIAAAYIAGVLPLDEAARVVARRSQALSALCGAGTMASVLLGADKLQPRLRPWSEALSIAAINGPSHTIISGDPAALEEFTAACDRDGIQIRPIAVDYASHSAQIEPLRERLLAELADLTPAPARIPLYSTVGEGLSANALDTTTMDADYWYRNLREPVRFYDALVERLAAGECTFVELSPHPVLAPAITDTLAGAVGRTQSAVITTLHRDRHGQDALATALAQLHNHGHSPSWSAIYPHARTVGLPTYAFEHRRYWVAPTLAADVRAAGLGELEHPLLGAVTDLADQDQVVLSGRLSMATVGWLGGHRVAASVLFPATGFIDMVLRAADYVECPTIDELVLHTPLVLSDDTPTDLQVCVQQADDSGRRCFSVYSRPGGEHTGAEWTLHASGVMSTDQHPASSAPAAPPPGVEATDLDGFYEKLDEQGYSYSGPFRSLRSLGRHRDHPGVVYAEVELPADTDIAGYGIHPALLDAALHPLAAGFDGAAEADSEALRLPFAFSGISLHATAATRLHVELTRIGANTFRLHATDPTGAPVISIDTLTLRDVPKGVGHSPVPATAESLFELAWPPLPDAAAPAAALTPGWALVTEHTELAALAPPPELVIWRLPVAEAADEHPVEWLHALTGRALTGLQDWLARPDTAGTELVVLTRHAVTTSVFDRAPDLAHAAVWALIHSAQNEHPGRIVLLDTDDTAASEDNIAATVARRPAGEPQLALRSGTAHIPRLTPSTTLRPPPTPAWKLATTGKGDLSNLALVETDPVAPLGPGQIRIQVRAAGLNFHDVVVALGAIADEGLGAEAAGVVIDTAPDVTSVRPGDAVMGLFSDALSTTAVTDHRSVVVIPPGWSFTQAASVPVAFLTAYIVLVEIAGLSAGQRVLIHAGAGGVGQAAIQIAGHLGAEVFATAHPTKQRVLHRLGVAPEHVASSRTLDFVEAFQHATNGDGMDVVLNSLRGDFIDASLNLLPRGGWFTEIGKTDIRPAADIAAAHPGVTYQTFDLADIEPDRLRQAWVALAELFTTGALQPLPTTTYGLLQARQAFRDMSQGLHTGKIVLTPPAELDPDGTVLITGGTGMLGGIFAEHLITQYGIRHLLLVSRRGPAAPGAAELEQRLTGLGAQVTISACDIANPAELAAVVDAIPVEQPLTAVIHAAGVLDDAVISELTGEQLDAVLAAKADAAWYLDQLTADRDLAAFVLFSSAAATLGSPGQANYAAANAFLDALAQHQHRRQRRATSLAWGYWETPTGMTGHLGSIDQARVTGNSLTPITNDHGLALFDAALSRQQPALFASPISASALARQARQNTLAPVLSALTRSRRQAAAASPEGLAARLTAQTAEQQLQTLTTMVATATATVLAHPDPAALDPDRPFKDIGIDSLTALELRNTLNQRTGLVLPATLVFDYPTPAALATQLGQLLTGSVAAAPLVASRVGLDEPVAVVGMACRFPGGVDSAAALWDLVASGTDGVGAFPSDRGWNLADLFDPDPEAVGKTYTRAGGFLPEVAGFDAEFFGISAREAESMDPQQRLLLEVCWEALETARIDPGDLVRTDTGVFVGAWSQPYGAGGSDGVEGYGLTGLSTSVASGRVAYALGLQGPAITVDTACSSSLVATHLACQSLRNGESGLALAGGVTVMTTPTVFTEFARQRGLAADGRCKTFSAAADGTGFGEGAAVLVLERLSDAHRNNHPVLAVIAGSAINQDGASNGLTAPNGPAQQRVITQAVANAGIGLDQVDVVEAHGTGTTLGDPIEAAALIATYGAARSAEHPLWLGSIKSNIGHTQAAAGVAGMIKMIEALNHDTLPPTLNVDRPSPHIDWSAGTVRLLTESVPWPVTDHPRTAAVSSFGISGTNAHVILQQAPTLPAGSVDARFPAGQTRHDAEFGGPIWPVSARTPAALCAQADRLRQYLVGHPDLDLTDVAYSLGATRSHHSYRAVITASVATADPRADLLDALDALHTDRAHPQLNRHHYLAHLRGKTVFVLPGQGGQYLGMGRELYEHHRVFADTVDACDQALRPFTDWSVREVLCQDSAAPALDRVDVVQPVLFTMMVSLAEVLRRYGIVPDAVIGHSQGEIAAAYIAGVLSLPEAAKVVARRSQALSALRGAGVMASVLLGADELQPRLRPWSEALSIAAINGPSHTIISGHPAALEEFTAACERDGIQIRSIAVDYASHSAQVEPLRERLLAELADLTPAPARIPLYSTVGEALSADPLDTTTMDADYWYRNLREPVRFYDSVVECLAGGECTFVELSPHPVLAPAITDTLAQAAGRTQSAVITMLHRDRPDQDALATALAQLHNHGHSPSWSALYPHAHTVALPTYAFEHRRYWLASTPTGDAGGLGLDRAEHPLLGAVAELADQDQIMVSGRLSPSTQGWLAGHQVNDTVVFPASGFIEVILRAGELAGCPVIHELVLHTALTLSEQVPADLQILVHPLDEHGQRPFTVHSRAGGQHLAAWTLHASGALTADQAAAGPALTPAPGVQDLDQDDFYERLAQRGYRYSGLFRSLRGIGTDPARPEVIYAEVALPVGADITGYGIHPALLDAALHPLASVLDPASDTDSAVLRLPYAFSGITLYATSATQLHVQLTRTGEDTFTLHATDPTGAPVLTISALTLRAVSDHIGQATTTAGLSDSLFELTWPAVPDLPGSAGLLGAQPPAWAICTDSPQHLPASLSHGAIHSDLATLTPCPDLVIWPLPRLEENAAGEADPLARVHALTRHVLAQLQSWLTRPDTANTQLVIVTSHAVSVSAYDGVPDLAHAAAWALIHTAQNEHRDRIILLDTDDTTATKDNLLAIASTRSASEPQLALRNGVAHIPRLARTSTLTPPDAPDWQLASTGKGDLTSLTLVPANLPATLDPGQIRIQVRAAGLNFRDVVVALGAITDEGLGGEAAGVVLETAPGSSLRRGDAVMGLFPYNAFAPTAITDERRVVVIPPGWSFAQAASVPVAFLTAYIALVEIARLSAGQRVLIHAGAGGVGQAAIQIAGHLGAEVFATAHPNKHHVLNDLGVGPGHIASSRTLDFVDIFDAATDGQGMDVVLNSLSGEFVDASLKLLSRGGSFIEIGKTDIRQAGDVATAHPGVDYQAYDMSIAAPEALQPAWAALTKMFAAGALKPMPTTSYGLLNAPQAFRDMSQARHTGKIVLIPPAVLDPEGTVLITGGTGMLGALFAEHLITRYGVEHLLLLSRSGPNAAGADELQQRLTGLGAHVTIASCDTSDPAELAAALDTIPAGHPLTAVLHTAGVLDDAVVTELSPQQLDTVLAAKADAAWHLHHLTADRDLAAFVLFSSAAGILGSPGQANYAAANAFLDALARHRHHTQRQATSVAWGYWQTPTGMTAHLNTTDLTRLTSTGLTPITSEHGVALFDAALNSQRPNLLASPFNTGALTRRARQNTLDPILSALTTSRRQAATASPRTLTTLLATQTPQQRLDTLTAMVTTATATVLAHPDPAALDPDRPFKDLGIDSLTALELRNTLNQHTGLSLPATLVFDHPTPNALATHLADLLTDTAAPAVPGDQVSAPGGEPVDNRLAYLDQAGFLALRAVHGALIQITWIYDRAIDVDGLRRFHHNLGCGLLGRRIETSPLWFARDRWVLSPATEDIDFSATPRRRADVSTWVDERARLPIDPEWGPAWHLAVLPLEDGGTAVSLVASHMIVDAIAFGQAIADACEGRKLDLGYPPAGSRTRARALREDLRQTVKDLPEIKQAMGAVVRRARRDREELKSSIQAAPLSPGTASYDPVVELPALTASIDLAEWDARAKELGASSNSLVAGFACRLAVRVGRVHDDGTVTLRFLVSLRTEDDTRANALTNVDVTVDPARAATDLGDIQVEITRAILEAMENPDDEFLAPLPLASMTPTWAARRLARMAAGGAVLPVTCSNVGDLSPAANRPDGTDADYVYMRPLEPDSKKSTIEGMGGQLFLGSGRVGGKMSIRVTAYILGRENTKDELREVISRTFAEFGLKAEIDD